MGAATCVAVLQPLPISHHFHGCTALLVLRFVVVKWRYIKYLALPLPFRWRQHSWSLLALATVLPLDGFVSQKSTPCFCLNVGPTQCWHIPWLIGEEMMYVCQALQIVGFPLGSSLMKPSFWFTLEVMWLMCELKVMYYDRITPRYLGVILS